ncbi:MAG: hypothetical protein ACRD13_09310 [Terriglobales bacterium]
MLLMPPLHRLDDLARFRTAVLNRQAEGCFGAAGTAEILAALATSTAMSPKEAFYLRYGPSPVTGYVNLEPGFRLQATTLLQTRRGAVVGQQTQWFRCRGRPGGGIAITPVGRPQTRWYLSARPQRPPRLRLFTPAAARYWRLLWWLGASRANHFNMIVAAENRAALARATRQLRINPGSCAHWAMRGAWCQPLPRRTVLTAEIHIGANGRPAYVPFDFTIGQAMVFLGVADPAATLRTLRVWRRFDGRSVPIAFSASSPIILNVPLMMGDRLRWR